MTTRHPADNGIDGWLYPAQVAWLKKKAAKAWRIVEIGAYKGRSTHALATSTPGKVWTVDHWLGSLSPLGPENPHADDVTVAIREQGGPDFVFNEFMQNCGRLGNLTVMRMSSADAWRRLGHLRFDMVWIDASHDYESARDDILRWRAYLEPGGLLCGHDGEYSGVARAVSELVPKASKVRTNESEIWFNGPQ
jgi:predicted O-methyltransferase YrrM